MNTTAHSRGFTLIEVLIAIFVLAIGLLGVAGMQAFAVKNTQSANFRLVASMLATDITDRMRSNYEGVINGYYNKPLVADYNSPMAACATSAGCTPEQLAQNDLAEWAARVAAALPNGVGVVCVDSTPADGTTSASAACNNVGSAVYVVKIWWLDDRSAAANGTPQRFSTPFNP